MYEFIQYLIVGIVSASVFGLIIKKEYKEYNSKYNNGYNKELYIGNHTTLYTKIDNCQRTQEDIEYIFGKN